MSYWKDINDISCPKCGSNNLEYRIVEDDFGHEDDKYHCKDCNEIWWIEGSDY